MTVPLPAYVPPEGSDPPIDFGCSHELVLYAAADCRNFISMPPSFVPDEPTPYVKRQFAFWSVVFPDGVRVIVMTPLPTLTEEDKRNIKAVMTTECDMLQKLGNRGFPWSPRLLYHTFDDTNALGEPYMVYTMPPGKRLQWSDTFPAEKVGREKVLAQIARMNFDLLLFEWRTDWNTTAEKWVANNVDNNVFRSLHGLDDHLGIDARRSLYLRILARKLTQGKTNSKVFALSHENLFSHNIYVDENLNVTGFIGWGYTKSMPVRFATRFPVFLNVNSKHQPETMPTDPKKLCNEFFKILPIMQADRQFWISRMQFEFATRETRQSIGHLSPWGWEMMCWDLDNVDWQHLVLEAVLYRQIHASLSTLDFLVGCLPESTSGRIQELIPRRDLFTEAWDFYRQYIHKVSTQHRAGVIGRLLYHTLCHEYDWRIAESLMEDALGTRRALRPRA